jgi:hypothetical protein
MYWRYKPKDVVDIFTAMRTSNPVRKIVTFFFLVFNSLSWKFTVFFHALATVKNALWVRPYLSVTFYYEADNTQGFTRAEANTQGFTFEDPHPNRGFHNRLSPSGASAHRTSWSLSASVLVFFPTGLGPRAVALPWLGWQPMSLYHLMLDPCLGRTASAPKELGHVSRKRPQGTPPGNVTHAYSPA